MGVKGLIHVMKDNLRQPFYPKSIYSLIKRIPESTETLETELDQLQKWKEQAKDKLSTIQRGANKYVHPDNSNTRHVSDAQIDLWNSKETIVGSQAKADEALLNAKTYADQKIAALVDSAPEALDTLQELSNALGNDPNFSTTILEKIGSKVDAVEGKGLSSTDFTQEEKTKLSTIAENANYYVHPTTTGNKHIPSGGKEGQILRWHASGQAVWGEDINTEYENASEISDGLMSKEDKASFNAIMGENMQLKRILSMLAVMNGFDIPLDSDMDTIQSAFETLFEDRNEAQFIYGSNTFIIETE